MARPKLEQLVLDFDKAMSLKNNGLPQELTYFVWAEVIEQEGKKIQLKQVILPHDTNRACKFLCDAPTLGELITIISVIMDHDEEKSNMNDLVEKAKDILNKNQN